MKFVRATIQVVALSTIACPAWIPAYAGEQIPLAEFVKDALQADPIVREQTHAYRQIIQDYNIALSGWRPSLDLSAISASNNREEPTSTNFTSSQVDLTLSQNLFDGFNTTNQIKQAKSRISSAVQLVYDTADNAALEAIKTYLNVLAAKALLSLAEENVIYHERVSEQIKELNEGGIGLRSDVEQTAGRLAGAQANLISQQNNLDDSLTQLHKVLGRYLHPESLVMPDIPKRPEGDLDQLIEKALAAHPALQSARDNIEASRYDYERSKGTNFPRIDVQLQNSADNNLDGIDRSTREGSLQLSFQYNLYRGGADLAEQRKKISVMHEGAAFRARVRRQVIDVLRLAWTADQSLQQQLPLLKLHVEKATQTLEFYNEEFLINKRDLVDVLNAESELNTARHREVQARYNAMAARYRIYEGMGTLFQPLNLKLEATENDLRIADTRINQEDAPILNLDSDTDGLSGDKDHCDNSRPSSNSNEFGCDTLISSSLGAYSSNTPPTVVADSLSTPTNEALEITPQNLLGNDSDIDGNTLRIDSYTAPTHGALSMDADSNLIYKPTKDFSGTDSFRYTVKDSRGGKASGDVFIKIDALQTSTTQFIQEVRFAYKKFSLTSESQSRIEQLIPDLLEKTNKQIIIRAYTDNIASKKYNLNLSQQRAEALRQLLISKGIDENRITAIGMGEQDPISDNDTEEGRALNRRATIHYQH